MELEELAESELLREVELRGNLLDALVGLPQQELRAAFSMCAKIGKIGYKKGEIVEFAQSMSDITLVGIGENSYFCN